MSKNFFIAVLTTLILCTELFSMEVSNQLSYVREAQNRAQLSLILQISDIELIPENSSYEKELARLMKKSLKNALKLKSKLKKKKSFNYVFVTAILRGSEEILAILSKTPYDRYPSINFYPNPLEEMVVSMNSDEQPMTLSEQLD